MADDWIKIRSQLLRDTKVLSICDYLSAEREVMDFFTDHARNQCKTSAYEYVTRHVMRHVTIGALCHVWCYANESGITEGDDLVIRHASLDMLDDLAGIPCFGSAMQVVGWAEEEETEGPSWQVRLPRFRLYNTPESDRRKLMDAARAKKYREKKMVVERSAARHVTERDESRDPLTLSLTSSSVESLSPEGGTGGKPYYPGDEPQWSGPMDTPAVRAAFDRWYTMRRERAVDFGPAPRGTQLMAVVGRLTQWGHDRAVAALDLTTANGWKNIREPTAEEVAAAPPKSAWEMAQEDMAKREARRKAKANGQA